MHEKLCRMQTPGASIALRALFVSLRAPCRACVRRPTPGSACTPVFIKLVRLEGGLRRYGMPPHDHDSCEFSNNNNTTTTTTTTTTSNNVVANGNRYILCHRRRFLSKDSSPCMKKQQRYKGAVLLNLQIRIVKKNLREEREAVYRREHCGGDQGIVHLFRSLPVDTRRQHLSDLVANRTVTTTTFARKRRSYT